ncbi:MAG: Gfo/Idh/MocA family protein [Anaerolineae bacterium]
MDTTYKVGIIGCGRISGAHAAAYKSNPGYNLVAAADVKPEAARTLADKYGIPAVYTDYREMLASEKLDVVSICTWAGLHAEVTVTAAESGMRGILCEKPMAPSLAEAERMMQACAANGVKLAVGHQHRFDPAWVKGRELIAAGAIGTPLLVSARASDGLLNNGTHYLDGIRYVLGDPKAQWVMAQVERKTDRYERGEPIEDRLIGLVAFSNGTRALIEVDTPQVPSEEALPVLLLSGTKGTMSLSWTGYRLLDARGEQVAEFTGDVSSHQRQAVEFLRWLDGEIADYRCSAAQAYETVAIMMAMYESVRVQGVVMLPLTATESPLELMIASGRLPVEKPGKYDIRA